LSRNELYDICCRYHGRVVRIEDRSGRVHFGRITDVAKDSVIFRPLKKKSRTNDGYGYRGYDYDDDLGPYGPGPFGPYNYYYGAEVELALGFIVGIALAALFFF
jgi:hypothetical protein